jgi:Protein of unknown function (DUF3866)
MEVGTILDAAYALAGVPIACLRVSFADPRPRHQGLSHHTATALRLATRERVVVAVPALADSAERARLDADLMSAGIDRRHDVVVVEAPDVIELLRRHRLAIQSMGRPADDDPALFQAAAAAGTLAASYVDA